MADDDELIIIGESSSKSKRRKHSRNRKREKRRRTNSKDMPDSSLIVSGSQSDCCIIQDQDPQKVDDDDPSELIVLDSIGSDESDDGTSSHWMQKFNNYPDPDVRSLVERVKYLEEENHFLRYGNARSDGKLSIISQSDGPLIQVIFADPALAKKYRSDVDKILSEVTAKEKALKPVIESSIADDSAPTCSFVLDKLPIKEANCSKNDWSVPVYEKDFGQTLQVSKEGKETQDTPMQSAEKCFNCLGFHLIKDCTEEYNHQRVNTNKRNFYGERTPNHKNRLGNEKLWQLKYKAGEISNALRQALSLNQIQIPPYIYNMRIVGYPPGWLKEAELDTSAINIYGVDGEVSKTNNNEDGEIEEVRVQYDTTKVIDFPGFNVPLQSHCIDEHYKLGYPPMLLHQQRSEFEKFVKTPQRPSFPSRKRRRASASKSEVKEVVDMEVEEVSDNNYITEVEQAKTASSDEGIQVEFEFTSPLPVQIDDSTSQGTASQPSSGVSSPSLTDLEERKERLMHDLEEVLIDDSDSQKKDGGSLEELEIISLTPVRGGDHESCYSSKSVVHGTPVLVQHSPFKALPEPNSFADGISDHLNYENLPNATGCYDKLRVVLGKVREKTKQVAEES